MLGNVLLTYCGYNCGLLIFRKSVCTVVQNAIIVVGGVKMRYVGARVFFKIVLFTRPDIFIVDFNIIVSIISALHVMETECCATMMQEMNLFEIF